MSAPDPSECSLQAHAQIFLSGLHSVAARYYLRFTLAFVGFYLCVIFEDIIIG